MVKKNSKVIIIGSNSFSAGSMIKCLLKKNFLVYGISRSNLNKIQYLDFNPKDKYFKFYRIDINSNFKKLCTLIKKIKPNYIINYASQSMVGQSWSHSSDWFKTNSYSMPRFYDFISTLNFKLKIVHISTPEVYGSFSGIRSESKEYYPTSPYAVSRVTADQYLDILSKKNKIFFASTRASNVYGPCQRLYRIIPKTIISILNRNKLNLEGGGHARRNFIFIDDVSEATLKIMLDKKNNNQIYHISGDKYLSIRNLVKIICTKMNYDFNKLVLDTPDRLSQDKFYSLSNKKLKKQYNWKETYNLEAGLDITINWIKNNLKKFNKKELDYIHKK